MDKCQTMMISRKKEPVLMDYYIDGQKLSLVKNHPYLGVMLSKDLNGILIWKILWSKQISHLAL